MIDLFSANGRRFLESVCFTRTLFAFDFDGTLSKIVKEPTKAKVTTPTLKLLGELGRQAPVAIISGRSLADLHSKFDPTPGFLVGNHGLEGIHSGTQKLNSFRDVCGDWKRYLEASLLKEASHAHGIEIEDKTFSIAIHYRKSRSKRIAKSLVLNLVAGLSPSARIILGKCVVNLIPPGAPHKGIALLELMLKSDTRSALYIGDDDTDEDVFSLGDPRIFSIRVGQKRTSHAKFFVRRQADVNELLREILSFIASESKLKTGIVHGSHRSK